jgi:nucleotide-binding universal stress UspA family protein
MAMVCRNPKRILFPTDFSSISRACLGEAEALAKARHATLIVLHVQKSSSRIVDSSCIGPMPPTFEVLERMFQEARPSDPTIEVKYRFAIGDPATEILRAADEEGVDMIVMATRGRSGWSRLWKESTAESVVRRAACPVVTCRGAIPATPRSGVRREDVTNGEPLRRVDYAPTAGRHGP